MNEVIEQEVESSVPQSEDDADQLLMQIDEASPKTASIQDAQPPAAAPAPVDEFEFTVGGKQIKAPKDKVITWAQLGYGANHKINELNKQLNEWKTKESRYSELDQKYGEIDKYVRENPQFWDHVTNSWKSKQQLMNEQENPMAPVIQSLQDKLSELDSFKQSVIQEREQQKLKSEDEQYSKALGLLKESHPQIDFDTPDAEGKSLEYRIIDYAIENKIGNLRTAFRDFYHDELVKMEAEKAKESVIKDRKMMAKKGIVGMSTTPTQNISDDVKGKSYNQLADEALAELGIR